MSDIPRYHRWLTDAGNAMRDTVEDIEQAYFADGRNPAYKKLHKAAEALRHRFFVAWEKSVKRGKKEGWL